MRCLKSVEDEGTQPASMGLPIAYQRISIQRLKIWGTHLDEGSVLRSVLHSESEYMSAEEYIAKIPTWLSIAEAEERRVRGGKWHG